MFSRCLETELDVGFGYGHIAPVPATASRLPTQARAQRTRRALLSAAAREFSRSGYAATTAKSIADRAEVAVGSFYQYFANKDVVLHELASVRLSAIGAATLARLECVEVARDAMPVVLGEVVDAVVQYHREDPGLHAVLSERRHVDAALDELLSAGESAFVDRVAELLPRWDYPGDASALAFVLFHMLEGSVHAHVLGRPRVDDERFRRALVDALVRLVRPPTAR
jgi:AcrR family transcriptional regulator